MAEHVYADGIALEIVDSARENALRLQRQVRIVSDQQERPDDPASFFVALRAEESLGSTK